MTGFDFDNDITLDNSRKVTTMLKAMFFDGEVDKIELIYTNFKNALNQDPAIRSVLPLNPTGLESDMDEIF